ncbi:MAG: hypothetical protein IJX85_05150 [Lachnospiraceae bacterium]|nr:hypothetical protein [Lachnospiraceae bacterium]
MAKKTKVILLFAIVALFIVVWGCIVINQNRIYDLKNDNTKVGIGQKVEFEDISYTITSAKMYDIEAFVKEYPDCAWLHSQRWILNKMQEDNDVRILCYSLFVETGDKEQKEIPIILDEHRLSNGMWRTTYDLPLIYCLNEGTDLEVSLNSSTTIVVPVVLVKDEIPEKDWNNLTKKNIGMEVVVSFQPELKCIEFDDVEYISASETDVEEFNVLKKQAAELESNESSEITILEDNVKEGKEGNMEGLHFKIENFDEVDVNTIHQQEYNCNFDIQKLMDEGNEVRLYACSYSVANNNEKLVEFAPVDTRIYVFIDGTIMAGMEYAGIKNASNEGTKSEGYLVVEPGKCVTVDVVYIALWSNSSEYESINEQTEWALEQEDSFYFMYNPSGNFINSLEDKRALFIKLQ